MTASDLLRILTLTALLSSVQALAAVVDVTQGIPGKQVAEVVLANPSGFERLDENIRIRLSKLGLDARDVDYLVAVGEGTRERAFALAETLRDELTGIRVETNLGGGSFKAQMKRADKSGAAWALILGEQELSEERIGLKPLRDDAEQESIALAELAAVLKDKLGGT